MVDAKSPLVLVADDDDTVRLLVRQALELDGFRVLEARDGRQALQLLDQRPADLLLADVEMPHLDGLSLCEEIRSDPRLRNIPILMMTGHDDAAAVERAFDAGATDFCQKPLQWTLLRHRVRFIQRSHRSAQELRRSRERLANAQRIARLGNWEIDLTTRELHCSDETLRIFGIEKGAPGSLREALVSCIDSRDLHALKEQARHAIETGAGFHMEYRIVRAGGAERVLRTEAKVAHDAYGAPMRLEGTSQDVTERRAAEAEIRYLAYHDSLTGLANRRNFRDTLSRAMLQSRRYGYKLAVVYLDLDNFTRINDTLGHDMGDLLLKGVAERVSRSVRLTDYVGRVGTEDVERNVARLGGDEFTLLVADMSQPGDAAHVANRLLRELGRPFDVQGHEIVVSASVGIAVYPDDSEDVDILLRCADTAMHHAKRKGKNLYQFYTESMNAEAFRRLVLETKLRKAIGRDQLILHYQPKIDARSGETTGMEALVRWQDPELGLIPPGDFIQVAEETGLIGNIDDWVLRTACAQAKRWLDAGLQPGRVAVNVSARHFGDPEWLTRVRDALTDSSLDGRFLELEITESMLMKDEQAAGESLEELRSMGISVAIDDFGTGYCSMRYLRQFHVSTLKVDRSFVQDVDAEDGAEIVNAILSLAQSLRLKTVAEGVETEEQRAYLRARQCDELQGYLISRPLTTEAMEGWLRDH
ncbi:MAG: EAL domain-containing protein [Proteobacteria bacterium]|nr:EAL domain-containing protein [Pseudomonadota bacterium]